MNKRVVIIGETGNGNYGHWLDQAFVDDLWEVLVDNTLSAREKWLNAHYRSARAMIDMIDGKTPEYELCLGPAARISTEMAIAARVSHIMGARVPFPLEEKGDPFETWK